MTEPHPPAQDATVLDVALRGLSRSANKGRLWFAVAAAAAAVPGPRRRAALRGVASLSVTSFVANAALKPLFRRQRPDAERTPLVRRLHRPPGTTAFPSGHAASAAAFTAGVALEHPRLGAGVAPLAAAVAYSRIHVGVHHVSDVVAGAALGAGVALAGRHWWPVRPDEPARVRKNVHAPALPDGAGLVVVVNPSSGNGDDPTSEIRRFLPAAGVVELVDATDLRAELAGQADRAKAFGVAGGDGTVAAVAAEALRHRLPLAVFPTGTLNHFARDVGLESVADTARAVLAGDAVAVDIGVANDQPFLNTSSLGAYPEIVRRREVLQHRLGKWLAMALATGQVLRHQRPLRLYLDDVPVDVWILFVGNGMYTPRGPLPAWRPRLDDGMLDVQYLRAGEPFSRTRAVVTTLAGIGDRSGVYQANLAKSVRVESRCGPIEIARDGEPGEHATRFDFGKLPDRLVVYRPVETFAPPPTPPFDPQRPTAIHAPAPQNDHVK